MIKRLLPGIMLLAISVVAVWAWLFYRENLRGIAPSVFHASLDAATLARQGKSPLSYQKESN